MNTKKNWSLQFVDQMIVEKSTGSHFLILRIMKSLNNNSNFLQL